MAAANHGDLCGGTCKKRRISAVFFVFLRAAAGGHVSFWRRVVIGGWAAEQGGFVGPGRIFVVSYYVVMIKMMVVRYTANIVQIIKSLSMWRRLRDDFSPVLVV